MAEDNNIFLHLGRLEGKVDGINARLDFTNGRIAKGEGRLEVLENKVWMIIGAFTLISIVAQLFGRPMIDALLK